MDKRVILISNDQRLGAILTIALADPDHLTIVNSPRELSDPRNQGTDAVVLDLPVGSRRAAYAELRESFDGRVLVPVDSEKDTHGWPPDVNRRFLVRPFQLADLIASVHGPVAPAPEPASWRRFLRVARRQAPPDELTAAGSAAAAATPAKGLAAPARTSPRPANGVPAPSPANGVPKGRPSRPAASGKPGTRRPAANSAAQARAGPDVPARPAKGSIPARPSKSRVPARPMPPKTTAPRQDGGTGTADPPRRAVPSQPRAGRPEPEIPSQQVRAAMADALAAQRRARERVEAEPEVAAEAEPASRKGPARVVGAVAAVIVTLLIGIGAGMLIEPDGPTQASPAPAPIVQERVVTRNGPAPTSCLAAIDNANATISYLINKIRDERLTKSLDQYDANRRACQTAGG